MSQVGYTPISLYYSSTAGNTPTAGNLVAGELAINTADGKLFYKDSAGVVQVIAGKGGAGVAGGSNTQVQYNSSGSLAGSSNFTFNGTTVTIANDASISGLTIGKGGGSQSDNAVLGAGALANGSNTGNYNVALGSATLGVNTSGQQSFGGGWRSLWSNTTGSYNVALGHQSMYLNTTGSNNTALGFTAMQTNSTGGNNTAVGYNALQSNTTASNNTAVGYQAGYSNTTGAANTFIGNLAGKSTTGGVNTFVGNGAGQFVTTGANNTVIGGYTGNLGGLDIRTASNYIVLSDGDGYPYIYSNGVNSFYFQQTGGNSSLIAKQGTSRFEFQSNVNDGYLNMTGTGNISFRTGASITQVSYINGTTGVYVVTSDVNKKKDFEPSELGLDAVMQLKPTLYRMKNADENSQKELGFIAQEVKNVIPNAYVEIESNDYAGNPEIFIGLQDRPIIAVLTKAIQELKAEVDSLKQQLASKQ